MNKQLVKAELEDVARDLDAHAPRYQPLDLASLAERLREVIAQIDGSEGG